MKEIELIQRLHGLVVFRNLLQNKQVALLLAMLEQHDKAPAALADAYGQFAAELFASGTNWSDFLLNAVLETENIYAKTVAKGQQNPVLQVAANAELLFFDELALYDGAALRNTAGAFLPAWQTHNVDFVAAYQKRMQDIGHTGYGVYAKHHMFTVEHGKLQPVRYPDPQRICELPGYEMEREKIIANTEALLNGQSANNVLLYGDAGTGKSSTVKALANEYRDRGLRLVEVKKKQLYQIPDLMEELADNPLKFILFIDDLSFSSNDDNFAALKAILEGSVGGRSQNIVVYATSNRRHLIKESHSERAGDDIHHSDTMQELMSLSARFGLTVTFSRPDRDRFSYIVTSLAKQKDIALEEAALLQKAEAYAIRSGGRSARVAKQFVDLLATGVLQ